MSNEYIEIDRFKDSYFPSRWTDEDIKDFIRILSSNTNFVMLRDINPERKCDYRLFKYKK
jgi:hypothetical protein